MRKRVIRPEELIPSIKPGSFLEVELAANHYVYVRQLKEIGAYAFYDYLSKGSQNDIDIITQRPILLTVSLLVITDPTWPIIGWKPLESNWPPNVKYWTVEPLPLTEEEAQNRVIKPNTEYFLIEGVGRDTTYTPVNPDELRGLPRRTLYPSEVIEEKLRLHFGLTPEGKQVEPLPLKKQPLW